MKIIITGATGFVGSECVRQCLMHPKITSVITLTRRPLADSKASDIDLTNPKLEAIVHEDLTNYTPELMSKLSGADACIWNLGTVPSKHNVAETTLTALDIPSAAIKAWNGKIKQPGEDPFRFVYVSGAMVERDQNATLTMAGEFRKMRGETENRLVAAEEETPETWKCFCLRMGKVLEKGQSLLNMVMPSFGAIKVDEAAACMIDLALHDGSKQILTNAEMREIGKKALETSS